MPEALRNRFQAGRFRLAIEVRTYVRTVHDPGKELDCGVFDLVLIDDRLEAAFAIVVPKFHSIHIEWNCWFTFRQFHDLRGRNEQELSLGINKLFYQPGTGDSINFHALSRHPLPSFVFLLTLDDMNGPPTKRRRLKADRDSNEGARSATSRWRRRQSCVTPDGRLPVLRACKRDGSSHPLQGYALSF